VAVATRQRFFIYIALKFRATIGCFIEQSEEPLAHCIPQLQAVSRFLWNMNRLLFDEQSNTNHRVFCES